jgi:hypothetical protein
MKTGKHDVKNETVFIHGGEVKGGLVSGLYS